MLELSSLPFVIQRVWFRLEVKNSRIRSLELFRSLVSSTFSLVFLSCLLLLSPRSFGRLTSWGRCYFLYHCPWEAWYCWFLSVINHCPWYCLDHGGGFFVSKQRSIWPYHFVCLVVGEILLDIWLFLLKDVMLWWRKLSYTFRFWTNIFCGKLGFVLSFLGCMVWEKWEDLR